MSAPVDTSADAITAQADALFRVRWAAEKGSKMRDDAARALLSLLAERDAARAEAKRLREAGRPLHNAAVAAVGSLKASDHKRAVLAKACLDWRTALAQGAGNE